MEEVRALENRVYALDAGFSFSEDDCRFPNGNAHKTINALRKFALAVYKNIISASAKKSSIKRSMLPALLDTNCLLDLLRFLWDGRESLYF